MGHTPFIWLGSGRSRKRDVGYKGKMLDLAARGGLPVPEGGILQDEFFRICLAEEIAALIGERVIIPDPVWLYEVLYRDIRFPRLKSRVAVRQAAAVTENNKQENMHAQLNVNFDDPQDMTNALRTVWSAGDPRDEGNKMDVLVMAMVETQTWGTASTLQGEEQDATTVHQKGGSGQTVTLNLPRPGLFRRSEIELPPFARRLQKLLGGTRRTFGRDDYQIDWLDDGEICWLIQVHE